MRGRRYTILSYNAQVLLNTRLLWRTVTIPTTAPKHRDLTGTPTPPRPPFKTYCLTTIMCTIIIILRLIIISITCYSTFATHKPAPAACHVHTQSYTRNHIATPSPRDRAYLNVFQNNIIHIILIYLCLITIADVPVVGQVSFLC